jgi:superfamily II DNA or RNA helicase
MCPLIDVADDLVIRLKKDFPEKTVSAYHSKIDRDEKESALKKDIIVSTIKSCGTGRDIPGLRVVICCEPIASKVVAEQMIGRLRPYEDKLTYFFDVCDVCIPPINYWWRARFKKIQTLVKEVVYLNLDQ